MSQIPTPPDVSERRSRVRNSAVLRCNRCGSTEVGHLDKFVEDNSDKDRIGLTSLVLLGSGAFLSVSCFGRGGIWNYGVGLGVLLFIGGIVTGIIGMTRSNLKKKGRYLKCRACGYRWLP